MPLRGYVKHSEVPIQMTNPSNPSDPNQIADDDIAELFDRQALEVPVALDESILAMAKAEIEQSPNASNTKQSYTSRYAPLFATAAVMVLAVALVPMLLDQSVSQEPASVALEDSELARTADTQVLAESAADSATVSAAAPAAASAEQKSESSARVLEQGGSAGATELITDASEADMGLELEAPLAKSSELSDTAATVRAPSALSTLGAAAVDSEDDYRVSQQSWLDEINRLFEADERGKFLYELTLFKTQHPNLDLEQHLPTEALNLDSSVGEQ